MAGRKDYDADQVRVTVDGVTYSRGDGLTFVATKGEYSLTLPAGQEAVVVTIPTLTDKKVEGSETFEFTASLTGQTQLGSPVKLTGLHAIDILDMNTIKPPAIELAVEASLIVGSAGAAAGPLDGTTAVNGGAKASHGNGFNLDAAGNVVVIGQNVRVWGSKTPATSQQGVDDFAKEIFVYKNNSFTSARVGENLVVYSGDKPKSQDFSESNKVTDLFLVHSQSGYANKKGEWTPLDTVKGGGGSSQHQPDYIVLVGDAVGQGLDGSPKRTGNDATVNALKDIFPTGIKVGGHDLEGVLNAKGAASVEEGRARPSDNTTDIEKVSDSDSQPNPDTFSYSATVTAEVNDRTSDEVLGDVLLNGIPAGFKISVTAGGDANHFNLHENGDGSWTLQWKEGISVADRKDLDATLLISHPQGDALKAGDLSVQVQSFNAHEWAGGEALISEPVSATPDSLLGLLKDFDAVYQEPSATPEFNVVTSLGAGQGVKLEINDLVLDALAADDSTDRFMSVYNEGDQTVIDFSTKDSSVAEINQKFVLDSMAIFDEHTAQKIVNDLKGDGVPKSDF